LGGERDEEAIAPAKGKITDETAVAVLKSLSILLERKAEQAKYGKVVTQIESQSTEPCTPLKESTKVSQKIVTEENLQLIGGFDKPQRDNQEPRRSPAIVTFNVGDTVTLKAPRVLENPMEPDMQTRQQLIDEVEQRFCQLRAELDGARLEFDADGQRRQDNMMADTLSMAAFKEFEASCRARMVIAEEKQENLKRDLESIRLEQEMSHKDLGQAKAEAAALSQQCQGFSEELRQIKEQRARRKKEKERRVAEAQEATTKKDAAKIAASQRKASKQQSSSWFSCCSSPAKSETQKIVEDAPVAAPGATSW